MLFILKSVFFTEWVIPVAGGAGGLIVLTIIIGICCKVMRKSTREKYKDNKEKKRKRSVSCLFIKCQCLSHVEESTFLHT